MIVMNNLPPLLCMEQSNFTLFILIPGPSSPNAIDGYVQQLTEEFEEL